VRSPGRASRTRGAGRRHHNTTLRLPLGGNRRGAPGSRRRSGPPAPDELDGMLTEYAQRTVEQTRRPAAVAHQPRVFEFREALAPSPRVCRPICATRVRIRSRTARRSAPGRRPSRPARRTSRSALQMGSQGLGPCSRKSARGRDSSLSSAARSNSGRDGTATSPAKPTEPSSRPTRRHPPARRSRPIAAQRGAVRFS